MAIGLLIVEDHAVVREGLVRLLARQPDLEIVGVAGTGTEALTLLAQECADVVLLDIALPGESGLELIPAVRECCPAANVLLLSMYAEPEVGAAALDRGAKGLVSKTASVEELMCAIRAVARGETLAVRDPLTAREREILRRIAGGSTNEEIAQSLAIQPKTVEGHCQRIMTKLDIHTRAGLVAYGRRASSQQKLF